MDFWYKGYADAYDWDDRGFRLKFVKNPDKTSEYNPRSLYKVKAQTPDDMKNYFLGWNVALHEISETEILKENQKN